MDLAAWGYVPEGDYACDECGKRFFPKARDYRFCSDDSHTLIAAVNQVDCSEIAVEGPEYNLNLPFPDSRCRSGLQQKRSFP
jgi:hypothetical protein